MAMQAPMDTGNCGRMNDRKHIMEKKLQMLHETMRGRDYAVVK